MSFSNGINQNNIANYFVGAKWGDIGKVTSFLVGLLLIIGGLLLLVILFFGAFKYMTAGGTAENMESAKKTFSYAIVGFIVVVTAFLIVKVITYVLNIPFIL